MSVGCRDAEVTECGSVFDGGGMRPLNLCMSAQFVPQEVRVGSKAAMAALVTYQHSQNHERLNKFFTGSRETNIDFVRIADIAMEVWK